MKWSEIGNLNGAIAVLLALLVGIVMALGTYQMRKHGLLRRGKSIYSTLLVIIGVAGTVGCVVVANVITIEELIWLVLAFVASGLPMIFESLISDHKAEIAEALHD